MAKRTIDLSAVRRIAAELDCDPVTVKKVFKSKKPTRFPISKKIFAVLVRDGYLDDPEAKEKRAAAATS